MQDLARGSNPKAKDEVKDGLSYAQVCLWRRDIKKKDAQKFSYRFRFLFPLAEGGLYQDIRMTILWIM